MNALGLERGGDLSQAHQAWQRFLAAVEANPGAWPGDQARHICALVWRRMGNNAATIPDEELLKQLPNHPDRPRPLRPGPEECYRQSLNLVPEAIPTWQALLFYQRRNRKLPQAIATARELLKRDANHLETWVALGDMLMETTDYFGALQAYGEALRHNPLDREIRQHLARAQVNLACVQVAQDNLDAARQGFQAALEIKNHPDDPEVLIKWAACEIKAGNHDRAEEMITRARSRLPPLALSYSLLIECIRMKLPAAVKKRFDREFMQGLAEQPTPETVCQLARITAEHHASGINYVGQKSHQNKVKAYIRKGEKLRFDEPQLEMLCESLQRLQEYRLTRIYTSLGQRKFTSPMFPLIAVRVELSRGPGMYQPIYQLSRLLRETEQRLHTWDTDPRRKEKIQEEVAQLRKVINSLNPFLGMVDAPFDFPPIYGEDDEDAP
jgi:tetratricopeptide (TPR) repeat protein